MGRPGPGVGLSCRRPSSRFPGPDPASVGQTTLPRAECDRFCQLRGASALNATGFASWTAPSALTRPVLPNATAIAVAFGKTGRVWRGSSTSGGVTKRAANATQRRAAFRRQSMR